MIDHIPHADSGSGPGSDAGRPRILVAGMGNVLRRDDGFGVEVARRLSAQNNLPAWVKVIEVGIGGVHLVHELMAGYDVLVVIDALARGSEPGTVHLLQATVPDLAQWPAPAREDFLADMHYTTPSKALILARALGILPPQTYLIGCQPAEIEEAGIGLSQVVRDSIERTLEQLEALVQALCRTPDP